jgi:eukaryotic-like serine/threonine-protein kinase
MARPFIVMELLEGKDLRQVLLEHGRLPYEQVVTYALQVCEALAAAHALGIIHRDIKPSNLFLTKRKQGPDIIKVLDVGISKTGLDADALGHWRARSHAGRVPRTGR